MRQRFIFLCYHGFGHINACLKLAQLLKDADCEVYFAGIGYFQQYVLSQGFSYHVLKSYPFGLGLEKWLNTIKKEKYVYLCSLRDRITDSIYKSREVDLYWMLQGLQPDIVLIDARQATDFIVMYNHLKSKNIKAAILQPMLPLHLTPGHPPMNSDVFPHDEGEVKKAIRKLKWTELKKTWKKKLAYLGFDDKFIIRRRIRKNAVPELNISKAPSLLNFALQHIDEFILVPQAFDFPIAKIEPTRHYIGFMPNEKRNDSSDPVYKKKEAAIFSTKNNKNLKLLYCSFGTIALEEKEIVLQFLRRLIAVAGVENYLLLISLQAQPEEIDKLQLSENVHIFNSVPQLEVLRQADIFITHGGINSIKESIFAEVPMLMYPVHSDYDPKGNAVRVAYHGLGLRGNITSDTEKEIQAYINELLSNPLYKRSIQELKRKDSQYTLDQFLEKINSIKLLSSL